MLIIAGIVILNVISAIDGHGYMISPPARNSMWRLNFSNPINNNDNEQFCGGREYQIGMKGKCGICGDPTGKKEPHMQVDGGIYANNIISETYKRGQNIQVKIRLTANHRGSFQFRIGKYDDTMVHGDSLGRLDGYLLKTTDGKISYTLPNGDSGMFSIDLRLPSNLTCKRCILQWWYRTANHWGCDGPNNCGLGRGEQENFVNCADVSILG